MNGSPSLYKAATKAKRYANREWSTNRLIELGVNFTTPDNGFNLVIKHRRLIIDFVPGTGAWRTRQKKAKFIDGQLKVVSEHYGRGVDSLVEFLGIKEG